MADAVADVVAVLVFVIAGRGSHHESGSFVASTLRVAAPFLIALAAGWLLSRAWRAPSTLGVGLVVWVVTVAGGMAVRKWLFDRSVAASFIVVASVVLMVLLLGWRFVANRVHR